MNLRAVVKKVIPSGIFKKIEPAGHMAEAMLAQTINGFPAKKLKIIAVTGTDGKTSTSVIIYQMLKNAGLNTALMTTVSSDYADGKGEIPNPTRMTTLGAMGLAKKLKLIKNNGAEWLVLEVTSHALAQHRVLGVPIHIAVLTNLSHEHLDYHGTFQNYLLAKRHLFELANQNPVGLKLGVINSDDANADKFAEAITNKVTYGIKSGDLKADSIKLTPAGSRFVVKTDEGEYRINCHLPGSFNIYNVLSAMCVGRALGLNREQIEKGIDSVKGVAGRMTKVDEGQDFTVIVDYAHTPDSFEKLFNEMRPVTKGKLIVMFGSAGRRDESKRAKQGEVAGRLCDLVVVTEEDDRDIDGIEIMDQIAQGAKSAGKVEGKDLFLVHNRELAVKKAIDLAGPNDTVLLLGKGHETNILGNGPQAKELRHLLQDDSDERRVTKRPYNEVETAKKALKQKTG